MSESTTGTEYKFSNYSVFEDAKEDVDGLVKSLDEKVESIKKSVAVISNSDVFAGPVAETCIEALELLNKRLEFSSDNFTQIGTYFEEISKAYKESDEKASKMILSRGDDGKLSIVTNAGLVGDTNEEKIFNYFKAKGFTDAEACGVMACIYHESRFLPGADRQVPGDESYGICQWLAERRTALENYCKQNGKEVSDLEAQLDFIFYECETTQKVAAMNNLKAITDETEDAAAAAADRWLIDYEGIGKSRQTYQAHSNMRQATARELYKKYHK